MQASTPLDGREIPMIPLAGASSAARLDESLAAVDLDLTPAQHATLDTARRQVTKVMRIAMGNARSLAGPIGVAREAGGCLQSRTFFISCTSWPPSCGSVACWR
jgi:hypothetical protein